MDVQQWKIERIHALKDEVKDLHPTLGELFLKLPDIKKVHKTHGSQEMGADFVLIKEDQTLLQEKYVGVIVKSTDIKQDHADIKRQIDECAVERKIEGGKKSVFLTEIWVVTSQSITKNAQEKLYKDHKTTNLSFLDGEALAKLIEKYYPAYWDHRSAKFNSYIASQQTKLTSMGRSYSLLPPNVGSIRVEQQIHRISTDKNKLFRPRNLNKSTQLITELAKRRAMFIEGGMGSGKSELLRSTAMSLLNRDNVDSLKVAPLFMTYRELKERFSKISEIIADIKSQIEDNTISIALFVDGMDEVADSNEDKISTICKLSNDLNEDPSVKLVVTSRNIDEVTKRNQLEKSFDMFAMSPLPFGGLVNFIKQICNGMGLSQRLREDLQKSPLLKALPRTPLSAILLAKLLSENIKDLPSTLPELYSKYTELVLGRWDINKGHGSEKEYETIFRLTTSLAAYLIDNDLDTIGIREIERIFKDYLEQRNTGQGLVSILGKFLERREIVAYDEENMTIQFRHRTFMEFFYAQGKFLQYGQNAPVQDPFHPYWKEIEYFYLGLVKDAPDRIKTLSALEPDDDVQSFIKCTQLGSLMLAAYQTPYTYLEDTLYRAFIDAAELFCSVTRGERNDDMLAELPELQILALLTQTLKRNYNYDFFKQALITAKLRLSLEPTREETFVAEFFIDSVLAELGEESAFVRLVEKHESDLTWSVRLGISFSAKDAEFTNDAIRRMDKKLRRAGERNAPFARFIHQIETVPMKDRKIEKLPKAD